MPYLKPLARIRAKSAMAYALANLYVERIVNGPNRMISKKTRLKRETNPDKLKIAIVSEYYYPHLGGITSHVEGFTRHCLNRGHDVRIITPFIGQPDYPIPFKDKIIHLGHSIPIESNNSVARFSIGLLMGRQARALLERERFDIVHCHSVLYGSLYFAFHKNVTDELMIGTLHTNFTLESKVLRFFKKQIQWYFNDLDHVFSVSQTALDSMQRYVACGPHTVLPNGIDIDRFREAEKLPVPPLINKKRFTVISVGRLESRNGFPDIIRVLDFLRKTEGIDAELIIFGEGPEKARTLELSKKLGIESYVKMPGSVVLEKQRYLVHADALFCGLRLAANSIALLEYLAAGRPVVATDHVINCNRNLLAGNLLTFDMDFPEQAAKHLATIAKNPLLAAKLSKSARLCAEEYSWSKIGDSILEVYRNLIESRNNWADSAKTYEQAAPV